MRSVDPRERRWGHHEDGWLGGWLGGWLEGWQIGVVAVGIAALGAALVAPFGAEPSFLPVPMVDRREQARAREGERSLADATASHGLSFNVRVVGERLRRFGTATAAGDVAAAALELEELRAAFPRARASAGDDPLLALRAVQTESFLAATRRWEATGAVDRELAALAGDLERSAREHDWLVRGRLALSTAERSTFYHVRWAELVGALDEPPFAPSLNEWRAYYRFLLEHPRRPAPGETAPPAAEQLALGYVEALARRDPTYPRLFARGVLWDRLGDRQAATGAFGGYLAQPDAETLRPWALNHLAATLAGLPGEAPPR